MTLVEVKDKKTRREFLKVPLIINKNDPNWIRPLDVDIEDVFDAKKNKALRNSEAIRWVLKDKSGNLIGRTAAFINKKTADRNDQPTGGMGFFDCINDQDAASLLFEACQQWLERRGMEAMDGPINFGERDRWWGVLVDGFSEPNYCANYNQPYYQKLFEEYGFKIYFNQYTYRRGVTDPVPEKQLVKADRIAANPGYTFEHISLKKLDKFAGDFSSIYNAAWVKHESVAGISKEQALVILKKMKPIIDEQIVWYAYYEGEPAGFFIMLPEVNQIFKYVNGKMNWLGKIKFLWYKWRGVCRKMFGVVFGIVPDHQGKGLEVAIVMAAAEVIQPLNRYDILELNWIGDFNPKMMRVTESMGVKIVKTHITYRKLFDPDAIFKRAPMMD
ncbi:MAG: hypothetical protein IIA45_02515 [Bacteroidetes bacterium]|nr:hypothetical protein [Bacteroidota bacterium]